MLGLKVKFHGGLEGIVAKVAKGGKRLFVVTPAKDYWIRADAVTVIEDGFDGLGLA